MRLGDVDLLQPRHGRGQAEADRRAVVDQPDLDLVEEAGQDRMVQRQRALREGARREDDQADPVVGTAGDEVADHGLGRAEPVQRLEVERPHAAADVQGDHDVDALALDLLRAMRLARPRRRHDQQRHGQADSQGSSAHRAHPPARARRRRSSARCGCRSRPARRAAAAAPPGDGDDERQQARRSQGWANSIIARPPPAMVAPARPTRQHSHDRVQACRGRKQPLGGDRRLPGLDPGRGHARHAARRACVGTSRRSARPGSYRSQVGRVDQARRAPRAAGRP